MHHQHPRTRHTPLRPSILGWYRGRTSPDEWNDNTGRKSQYRPETPTPSTPPPLSLPRHTPFKHSRTHHRRKTRPHLNPTSHSSQLTKSQENPNSRQDTLKKTFKGPFAFDISISASNPNSHSTTDPFHLSRLTDPLASYLPTRAFPATVASDALPSP